MTWNVLSKASTFYFFQRSELKWLMLYIFISLEMYSWSMWRQNGQKWKNHDFYRRTPVIYYVTVYFRHSNLEIKINIQIQFSPIFLSKKEEYYHPAQVDFDFGQVHIVWWLSYCQVEEKISVEPCYDTKIWNNWPTSFKANIFLDEFKTIIKLWDDPKCKCPVCDLYT